MKVPEKNPNSWTREEIIEYCSQSKTVNTKVSCENMFGNISRYDLRIKVQCIISVDPQEEKGRSKISVNLEGWKMK